MMAAAMAASVAACTPQDKKGGTKPPTETTIQAKGRMRAHTVQQSTERETKGLTLQLTLF